MFTSKNNVKISHFVWILSFLNFLFFHFAFFTFVYKNLDFSTANGIVTFASLFVMVLVLNAFMFYLFCSISPILAKIILIIFFILSSISTYFVLTYGVIIDESMISNILNTKYSEASSFFSFKLVLYLLFLGILPSIYISRASFKRDSLKKFLKTFSLGLLIIAGLVFANSSNWLWIDKHSKVVGGLAMPWSYTVNLSRFYIHEKEKNQKEILLPNATISNNGKSIVVLVIGESARSQNFGLYNYAKNTNPRLSKIANVSHFDATSLATYTTAGVKAILEHKSSDDLYEILPNYLFRNDVEVIWRTTNWGEPPVHIKNYLNTEALKSICKGEGCEYDEVLLSGLKEQIQASKKNKILVILHTSTSHGPTYSKKYPPQFEIFKPVCNSVELGKCSQSELINAYDNTIVYTDYILSKVIEDLQTLKDYKSTMMFVSDHGESLGEKNLYMHGVPLNLAPKEQYEIPFIVWVSDSTKKLKPNKKISQSYVFHSVLNFLSIKSPIYNEELNIFEK